MPPYVSGLRQDRPDQQETKKPVQDDLPPSLSLEIAEAIESSWAKASHVKKGVAIKHFKAWAELKGIPESQILPASEHVLAGFAAHWKGRRAGGTVRGYLSAIHGWHVENGEPWFGGEKLRRVLMGVEKATPASSKQGQRRPVTDTNLKALTDSLSRTDGFDACVRMIACVAFFSQLRLGEILPNSTNTEEFDSNRWPTYNDIFENFDDSGYTIHLPSTKTTGTRGDDVFIPVYHSRIDPSHALRAHIRVNGIQRHHPLASYRAEDGPLQCMTRKAFIARVNQVFATYGIPRITGHCFRIGGTTFYLLSGTDPNVVKAMGRWKSEAFLRYWRSVEQIASKQLGNVNGFGKRIR